MNKLFIIKNYLILFVLIGFAFLPMESAQAAMLYAGSATQVVYQNETVVIDWFLDTEGDSINTLQLKLNYSKDTLEPAEVTTGNSLFSLWIQEPKVDEQSGTISLTAGVPNGIADQAVPVFRTSFKAIKTGSANISIDSSSILLKNDGRGTTLLLKMQPVLFPVINSDLKPASISSDTHPDQNKWYQSKDVKISFVSEPNTLYSYSFSSNLELIPDDQPESASTTEYHNLPDGIYYFKLNSRANDAASWEEAGVYRVQLDATSPDPFIPELGVDDSIAGGRQFVSFATLDKTSGISHYKIKNGLFSRAKIATSPYLIHRSLVGDKMSITAVDNAGNERTVEVAQRGWMTLWQFLLGLVVLIGLLIAALYFRNKQTNKNS